MFHRLVQIPASSVKFQLIIWLYFPRWGIYALAETLLKKFNTHLLQHRLHGAQPRFDDYAFMLERQDDLSTYLQPWDVLAISKAFYRWSAIASPLSRPLGKSFILHLITHSSVK